MRFAYQTLMKSTPLDVTGWIHPCL